MAPPETTFRRPTDARVGSTEWEEIVFAALVDLFGEPFRVAEKVGGYTGRGAMTDADYERYAGADLIDAPITALQAARLSSQDRAVRARAADFARLAEQGVWRRQAWPGKLVHASTRPPWRGEASVARRGLRGAESDDRRHHRSGGNHPAVL
jgi:hypothetical protein